MTRNHINILVILYFPLYDVPSHFVQLVGERKKKYVEATILDSFHEKEYITFSLII